jgi:hypothetical protein
MQRYWYVNDDRRERFVAICRDKDVQELTFDAYMNKELVKAKPLAHVRIFFKNLAHLTGLAPVREAGFGRVKDRASDRRSRLVLDAPDSRSTLEQAAPGRPPQQMRLRPIAPRDAKDHAIALAARVRFSLGSGKGGPP